MLARYYAGEGQYLEVNHHQQPKLCLPGPVSIFFNPIIHKSIITNESIFVNSNEALVVYQIHSDGEKDAFNKLAAKDKTIETGMILSIDQAAATRYICRNQPNPSQNLFCSHSINIHVCSHYVLRVLITCLWDPRCHPYVFESRIA